MKKYSLDFWCVFFSAVSIFHNSKGAFIEWSKETNKSVQKLSLPFTSRSLLGCIDKSSSLFPDKATAVIYSESSHRCVPGLALPHTSNSPRQIPGEVIFYKQYPRNVCNETAGFSLHELEGYSACLIVKTSPLPNFFQSYHECISNNGIMFTANNMERMKLLMHVTADSNEPLWIGLMKISNIQGYRWVKTLQKPSQELSFDEDSETWGYWANGQPSHEEGHECVIYRGKTSQGFDDVKCATSLAGYVCEQSNE